MGRPRSNNLQSHLTWALSSGQLRPSYSFWDSAEIQRSGNLARATAAEPEDNDEFIDLTNSHDNSAMSTSGHRNISLADDATVQPSLSLPTPPSNEMEVITMDSESDSDLEYFANLPGVSKPNLVESKNTATPGSTHRDTRDGESSGRVDEHGINLEQDNVHVIETSSDPATPTRTRSDARDADGNLNFRFTQAPDAESEPRQELSSFFSEKIALLEQKIKLLSLTLASHGISCDTNEIDRKIREVDGRIVEFPGDDDDDIVDVFQLSSSPQVQRPSAGIPFEINNDQFDSDFTGDQPGMLDFAEQDMSVADNRYDEEIKANRKFEDNVIEDEDEDDDIEILGCSQGQKRNDPVSNQFIGNQYDGQNFGNYEGAGRYDDESIIIGTGSLPPATQASTQSHATTQLTSNHFSTSAKPWTREMMQILRTRFGLQGFRPNQAEAVNETLSGNDVVVLMPTGGGKSLCYQLPALVSTGCTKGTTVVISPLISLMQDQVYHLKNRNIQAEMLNSRLNASERSAVFSLLNQKELQLLYISPEMLSASAAMRSALQRLYSDNRLARIVIDEAHCVSAWGHDFRPEYMELTKVKSEFPTTPIMALTATANERVLLDIVGCLRSNPLVLKQSFNRRNLFYEVRNKTANLITEVASVCRMYARRSGIIYCHSKRSCEETSSKLQRMGIAAGFYHAGMTQEDRADVQQAWQQGRLSVVCATIAFGMGIDKPDVRYVMHITLPRNIEGYYQETGRAGRDGKFSHCILFYSYRDVQMLQKMTQQDTQLSAQVREHHRALLIRVMQYCENKTDCRRQQVLQYFNEDFNPKLCHYQCDNCRNMKDHGSVRKEMSSEAKLIIEIIREIAGQRVTTQQVTDVLLGRRTQKAKSCGFDRMPWFGQMHALGPLLVERLVHALVSERVIEEYSQYNHSRFPQSYIRLGPMASSVSRGLMPIQLSMPRESAESPASASTSRRAPVSTRPTTTRYKRGSRETHFRSSKRSRA